MFYNLLVTRKILQSRAVPYWQQKINGFAISEDTWKNIWLFKLKYISDTRLINFNFKLMYNLIPVRKNLYKWNLADDANCTNCNIEEDVLHAFIDCAKLTPFWRWINTILKDIYPNTAINLNPHTVLFGKNLSDKLFYMYNFVLNCALFTIYKCIVQRNFENKEYEYTKLKRLMTQEVKNRIEIECKTSKKCKLNSNNIESLVRFFKVYVVLLYFVHL